MRERTRPWLDWTFDDRPLGGETIVVQIGPHQYSHTFDHPLRSTNLEVCLRGLCDRINEFSHGTAEKIRVLAVSDGLRFWSAATPRHSPIDVHLESRTLRLSESHSLEH